MLTPSSKFVSWLSEVQSRTKTIGALDSNFEIDVPQVACCGAQSSGKSTVVERLVGHRILPTGDNMVTRVPLRLTLRALPENKTAPYGVFRHLGDREFTLDQIPIEINRRTDVLTDGPNNVNKTAIDLTVFVENAIDLTLVDLPGLVTSRAGDDQSETIVEDLDKLVTEFTATKNTIILLVTPSSQESVTALGFPVVNKNDPKAERTVGVLTKCDWAVMTGKKNSVTYQLRNDPTANKQRHLSLGWFGVSNCITEDGVEKSLIAADTRKIESDYLNKHFPGFEHRLGLVSLGKLLQKLLVQSIERSLPTIKRSVSNYLGDVTAQLDQMGEPHTSVEAHIEVIEVVSNFARDMQRDLSRSETSMNDVLNASSSLLPVDFLNVARIKWKEMLLEFKEDACGRMTDKALRVAVLHANSLEPSVLPTSAEKVLKELCRDIVARLHQLCTDLARVWHEALVGHSVHVAEKIGKLSMLRDKLQHAIKQLLDRQLEQCNSHVETMLKCEQHFINLRHPDMQETLQKVPTYAACVTSWYEVHPVTLTPLRLRENYQEHEERLFIWLRNNVEKYVGICINTVADNVQKVTFFVLVHTLFFSDDLVTQLLEIIDLHNAKDLMKEATSVVKKREKLTNLRTELTMTLEMLANPPNFADME